MYVWMKPLYACCWICWLAIYVAYGLLIWYVYVLDDHIHMAGIWFGMYMCWYACRKYFHMCVCIWMLFSMRITGEYGSAVTPRMSKSYTSVEVGHNPKAQDLPRNKHSLVEGRIMKDPWNVYRSSYSYSIGGYVKPEGFGETIVVFFGLQNRWIYSNPVHGQEKSAMPVRMPEC